MAAVWRVDFRWEGWDGGDQLEGPCRAQVIDDGSGVIGGVEGQARFRVIGEWTCSWIRCGE